MGDAIFIAWTEMDGLEPTGRIVTRDFNQFPEYRAAPKPRAVLWSSSMDDLESGKQFAAANGYTVYILPDGDDALGRAKSLALAARATEAGES